jgi:hypothetical protein
MNHHQRQMQTINIINLDEATIGKVSVAQEISKKINMLCMNDVFNYAR